LKQELLVAPAALALAALVDDKEAEGAGPGQKAVALAADHRLELAAQRDPGSLGEADALAESLRLEGHVDGDGRARHPVPGLDLLLGAVAEKVALDVLGKREGDADGFGPARRRRQKDREPEGGGKLLSLLGLRLRAARLDVVEIASRLEILLGGGVV